MTEPTPNSDDAGLLWGRIPLRYVDRGVRGILALYYAFAAGVCFSGIATQLRHLDFSRPDAALVAKILSALGIAAFSLMVAGLFVLRLQPLRRTASLWPNLAALLGAFLLVSLLFLEPRDDLPLGVQFTSSLLVFVGNGFAVYVLTHLGRSFSILPEARRLVTTGVYRRIRHPLYLAEMVVALGMALHFWSALAVLIVVVQTALQILRMHYEERILALAFPDYESYRQRSAMLIPGIF